MKTSETYIKDFDTYCEAFDWMKFKNKSFEKAGNKRDTMCVVPGHSDNYAVVDHSTAINLGLGYVISVRGWVLNPWE